MTLIMGPVLGFQGNSRNSWQIGVLVVIEGGGPPDLSWSQDTSAGTKASPVQLYGQDGRFVWRFDLNIKQGNADVTVRYTVAGDKERSFVVPAIKRTPRVAYSSCNGFSSLKAMKQVKDNNALWKVMARKHGAKPYHLIIMGGDQLYADSMWETVPVMKDWAELSYEDSNAAPFTPKMKTDLADYYFNKLYCERWAQAEFRDMVACVPTLMMWDDHDIFDGWGSYKPERQNCAVYAGIFGRAKSYFELFQMQDGLSAHSGVQIKSPASDAFLCQGKNFSYAHRIGGLAIVAVDMRSERSDSQVLSNESWNRIFAWIDKQKNCDHLYFLSSIPVVHPDFSFIERALGWWPGQDELEDDLRDHWNSRPHKAERLRLIHRLLAFADDKKTRVTFLSGDVHVAALGSIRTGRATATGDNAEVILQLTSSGIVHPSPPGIVLFALEQLFDKVDEIEDNITAEMHKFPGTERRFIGRRNWLSLEPDEEVKPNIGPRIWANWIVEDEDKVPYTKVILPVEKETVPVRGTT